MGHPHHLCSKAEHWRYLCVVIDLYSRLVVGWSMSATQDRQLVLQAVLMALWQREGRDQVILHSDSENVIAGSVWWSDRNDVRYYRASGAGRPRVA
jgi:transposase InsO family protein